MTIAELKTKIEERGFTVESINSNGDKHELVVKGKDGSNVPWVTVMTGKSGAINSVAIKSYHPPKIAGQNEHSTVAVFGDLYMAHNGRPSAADKAVAAYFATPTPEVVEPEQKKEEVPAEAAKVEGAVIEQQATPQSSRRGRRAA